MKRLYLAYVSVSCSGLLWSKCRQDKNLFISWYERTTPFLNTLNVLHTNLGHPGLTNVCNMVVAMVTTKCVMCIYVTWLPQMSAHYLEVFQDQSFQSLPNGCPHEVLQLFWLGDQRLLREHDAALDGSYIPLQQPPPLLHWPKQMNRNTLRTTGRSPNQHWVGEEGIKEVKTERGSESRQICPMKLSLSNVCTPNPTHPVQYSSLELRRNDSFKHEPHGTSTCSTKWDVSVPKQPSSDENAQQNSASVLLHWTSISWDVCSTSFLVLKPYFITGLLHAWNSRHVCRRNIHPGGILCTYNICDTDTDVWWLPQSSLGVHKY